MEVNTFVCVCVCVCVHACVSLFFPRTNRSTLYILFCPLLFSLNKISWRFFHISKQRTILFFLMSTYYCIIRKKLQILTFVYCLWVFLLLLQLPVNIFWAFCYCGFLLFWLLFMICKTFLCNEITSLFVLNDANFISHFIVGLLILFYDCGFVVVAVVCFGVAIESSFYIIKSINLFGLVCE